MGSGYAWDPNGHLDIHLDAHQYPKQSTLLPTAPHVTVGVPAEHCYPVSVSLLRLVLRFLAPDYSTIERETKVVYSSRGTLELASATLGHPRDKGVTEGERVVCIMNSTIL
jgi:hypothetical protein